MVKNESLNKTQTGLGFRQAYQVLPIWAAQGLPIYHRVGGRNPDWWWVQKILVDLLLPRGRVYQVNPHRKEFLWDSVWQGLRFEQ